MTVFAIGLYSVWMRDDGVPREVYATGSGSRNGRWFSSVYTQKPLPSVLDQRGRPDYQAQRSMRSEDRREISEEKFRRTHKPLTRAEQEAARPAGYQLTIGDAAEAKASEVDDPQVSHELWRFSFDMQRG